MCCVCIDRAQAPGASTNTSILNQKDSQAPVLPYSEMYRYSTLDWAPASSESMMQDSNIARKAIIHKQIAFKSVQFSWKLT